MKRNTDPTADAEASAPRVLEELARRAERLGASDIHFQMAGRSAEVSIRLDGVMTLLETLTEGVAERVFGRIKYLAGLKTYQDLTPQDGRIDKTALGTRRDLRVATYPTVTGEKIVLRLFVEPPATSLSDLGLPGPVCRELEECLRKPSGLILLTGPAGSGKTTTIHASLRFIAGMGGRHIITVEDPVEQILPGIMQTEVCEERGLSFAKAASHLLRQDPQVLAIGEIRDDETAGTAVRAALTGHLVISTLHAGSCRGVLERLMMLCPDRFAIFSTLELILNQRLLRRLCAACNGRGCADCVQTGYRGRIPAVEWCRVTDDLRVRLREQGPAAICPPASLESAAMDLVKRGLTNLDEYERTFGSHRRPGST